MMRSLYSGVAGLQNHQVRMDVLGNNIANVNTTGFKKGRVNFQDMISQTQAGAAKPTEEVGGVNPKQVGLGMVIASIDTLHTQGSLQTTGVMTDLAIQGEGFFIQKASDKLYYTRAGAFGLDEDGFLVNPSNGMKVQGWLAQEVGGNTIINTASDIQDLVIPVGGKDPAKVTENVFFTCNLDKRTPLIPAGSQPGSEDVIRGTWMTSFEIFDSFGRAHKLQVNFERDLNVANRWRVSTQVDPDGETDTATRVAGNQAGTENANVFYLDFDNLGSLQAILTGPAANPAVLDQEGRLEIPVTFNVPETTAGLPGAVQTFNLRVGEVGSFKDSITQFGEKSSTKITQQDGYSMGYLESFKIDQSGVITGVYTNGTNRALGQVALASFTNPGGLEKAGENTYVVSNNSGEPKIGETGVAGKGKIIAGALEMSNVDLAEQFTDMIVTQRGFQANSRTITTSDQMLQEVLGLKR
jgi:flagellar hook protein FlgE